MDRRQFLRGVAVSLPVAASVGTTQRSASAATEVRLGKYRIIVKVEPPTDPVLSPLLFDRLRAHGAHNPQLQGTRWSALDGRTAQHIFTDRATHTSYLATVSGDDLTDTRKLENWQPPVTDAEWSMSAAVVSVAKRVPTSRLYRPMPPYIIRDRAGQRRRLVSVGILPHGTDQGQIALADSTTGEVVEWLPSESVPDCSRVCGQANLEGCRKILPEYDQWRIRVFDGHAEAWAFTVARARASAGVNASGVELKNVRYRARPILNRGNTPILNVKYSENECGCGPAYRDWFGDEACFDATGTDVGGGLRLADSPPKTIVDKVSDDADEGNYRGLVLYATDNSVVVVSETKAAWYRYVSEWHLSDHGDLAPRIAFAATENPCTCLSHVHHAYMRLDVPNISIPQIVHASGRRQPVRNERKFIRNGWSGISYRGVGGLMSLHPGSSDGTADDFGQSDVWLLKARDTEMDDLIGFTDSEDQAKAHLDRFLDGESLIGEDLALWYAVHFAHHTDCNDQVGQHPKLGPTLKVRPSRLSY